MTFKMLLGLALAVVSISASAATDDIDLGQIGDSISTSMLQCPEKIWSDYNWKEHNALIRIENQPPVMWTGATGVISPLLESEIPPDALISYYDFFKFRGLD